MGYGTQHMHAHAAHTAYHGIPGYGWEDIAENALGNGESETVFRFDRL